MAVRKMYEHSLFKVFSFHTGTGSVDEAKFIGGFQDVTALLNCLTGQSSTQSPTRCGSKQHSPKDSCSTLTSCNISRSKAGSVQSSLSKVPKEADEGQTVSVITDYDTGMYASLIYRKYNSLPRARAPKIFVNNLHNFTRSPIKSKNSSVKNDAQLPTGDTDINEGSQRNQKCNTVLASSSSSANLPLARADMLCPNCRDAAHTDHQCQHRGVPKRSKSFSTVSYIASPGGGCPCIISRSQPRPLCSTNKLKSCTASEHRPPSTATCSFSTNTTPVVVSKANRNSNSGELFLL